MCGIVGIWQLEGGNVDRETLDRFTDSLAHRGPDGRGVKIFDKASLGLGHRRLSVLDPTRAGHQPMAYAEKRFWITFNGEIYNFLELRSQLTRLGYQFHTETDTEVVLASFIEWGQDCQLKFNGMWAFAIWDTVEQVLFLSRDRFGVKPLFFYQNKGNFAFASELKSFMALPAHIRPGFDPEMVARMKNEESVDQTLLAGVTNLNGGCCLTLTANTGPKVRRWWHTADHLEDTPKLFSEQIERYQELFFDACRVRMRSDVPIGTALSGGLDSSSILCSMSHVRKPGVDDGERLAKSWQKAFVLAYSGTSHDERRHAQMVAEHAGADPIIQEIRPDQIDPADITNSILSFEAIQNAEPSLGPWLIYREMCRAGVKVSIDGLGGDETLAGYHEYLPIAMKDSIWPLPRPVQWHELQAILKGLYEQDISEGAKPHIPTVGDVVKSLGPSIGAGKALISQILEKWPRSHNLAVDGLRLLRSVGGGKNDGRSSNWLRLRPRRPEMKYREKKVSGWGYLQQYLYDDFHYGTNARSLRNFDRMSMAHGVESRAPFMDWRLVCFAFSIPTQSKLGAGFTKLILREAMRDVLPEEIRCRKGKLGFSSPMPVWYRYGLKEQVLDSLNSQEFLESEIWNGPVIRTYTEKCYQQEDYVSAVKSWKFIQAHSLMDGFKRLASSGRV